MRWKGIRGRVRREQVEGKRQMGKEREGSTGRNAKAKAETGQSEREREKEKGERGGSSCRHVPGWVVLHAIFKYSLMIGNLRENISSANFLLDTDWLRHRRELFFLWFSFHKGSVFFRTTFENSENFH